MLTNNLQEVHFWGPFPIIIMDTTQVFVSAKIIVRETELQTNCKLCINFSKDAMARSKLGAYTSTNSLGFQKNAVHC